MAKSIHLIRVFVASPGDVSEEREIISDAIDQLNRLRGNRESFRVEAVRWENSTRPAFGASPQEIINSQIEDDYDIFVGVLCSRFGTPTKSAGSGTEEEFLRARQRHEAGDPVEILFYFKDFRSSVEKPKVSELLKIEEFKDSMASNGLYWDFTNPEEFQTLIVAHLSDAVNTFLVGGNETEVIDATPANSDQEVNDDAEGLLELMDKIESSMQALTKHSETLSEAMTVLANRVGRRTEEVNSLTQGGKKKTDIRSARAVLDSISNDMDGYASTLEDIVPEFEESFAVAIGSLEKALLIESEFKNHNENDDDADKQQFVEAMRGLILTFVTVREQLSGFSGSVSSLPRLSSGVNRSKRRILKEHKRLETWFDVSAKRVETVLHQLG